MNTKFVKGLLACALVAAPLTGCSSGSGDDAAEDKTITIGASVTPHAEIINNIVPDLEELGYTVEVVEFSDYVKPNQALYEGELDCNYFQHTPYLEDWVANNCKNKDDLVSAAKIHFEPLGIYSSKHTDVSDVPDGAQIAVPNDTTNEARALQLLQAQGIITLAEGKGLEATKADIVENPYNVEIVELAAEVVPTKLNEVDFAIANGNNALNADITDYLLVTESTDSEAADQYANVIAVRKGDEDSQKIQDLLSVLETQKTVDYIEENYGGVVVPVFEVK